MAAAAPEDEAPWGAEPFTRGGLQPLQSQRRALASHPLVFKMRGADPRGSRQGAAALWGRAQCLAHRPQLPMAAGAVCSTAERPARRRNRTLAACAGALAAVSFSGCGAPRTALGTSPGGQPRRSPKRSLRAPT